MITDPCIARVATDLNDGDLVAGCASGRWRIVSYQFPHLDFAVSATEPDGTASEYGFRAELTNYPGQAPMVRIWDHDHDTPLATDRRPKGGPRIQKTFQYWQADTVYRPWDRMTGPHGENAVLFPHLAWRPERRLAFVFEDLHGILNCNARTQVLRVSA